MPRASDLKALWISFLGLVSFSVIAWTPLWSQDRAQDAATPSRQRVESLNDQVRAMDRSSRRGEMKDAKDS